MEVRKVSRNEINCDVQNIVTPVPKLHTKKENSKKELQPTPMKYKYSPRTVRFPVNKKLKIKKRDDDENQFSITIESKHVPTPVPENKIKMFPSKRQNVLND